MADTSVYVHDAMRGRYLIVNADDLGASEGVNRGILEAHRDGIVTSASLMVDMPGAEGFAAGHAHERSLSVGLHVTLTDEDAELQFDTAGCREELGRQLARFEYLLGRAPTHLDSHHNVHLEQPLTDVFKALAAEHDLPLRGFSPARYFADFYGQWDDETHVEQVSVETLSEMLDTEVGPGVTEFGCHPGYTGGGFESSYLIEREAELRTLCDPAIRARVEELGIRLIGFGELGEVAGQGS
jgi:chitin disaccharide deacetylase